MKDEISNIITQVREALYGAEGATGVLALDPGDRYEVYRQVLALVDEGLPICRVCGTTVYVTQQCGCG